MMPVPARPSSQSRPSQFPPPMPRIIQITAIPESDSHSFMLFALTADGEIYENVFDRTLDPPQWNGWEPIPSITKDGRPWP
jgi:hypothetical protein